MSNRINGYCCNLLLRDNVQIKTTSREGYRVKPAIMGVIARKHYVDCDVTLLPSTWTETSSLTQLCCFYRAAVCRRSFLRHRCLSVRTSVRPSVCLSVTRVNWDKTKAPTEKSSIMTNRKSPTSFPMSLRWTSYVAPNHPKGASKAQIWPIICNNFETVRDRM